MSILSLCARRFRVLLLSTPICQALRTISTDFLLNLLANLKQLQIDREEDKSSAQLRWLQQMEADANIRTSDPDVSARASRNMNASPAS